VRHPAQSLGLRYVRGAISWSLALLAPLLPPGELQARQGGTGQEPPAARPAAPPSAAAANGEAGEEPIRPGDAVRLTVWRHEDLSGEFPVNQYGVVVLPKLGEVDTSSETHRSLRDRVIGALRETVVSPSIEVVVLKRVRVLGEVQRANVFLLDPTMTVADALAMAGGTTPQGRQGTVVLRRNGVALFGDLRVDTRVSDAAVRSGDELVVPQRSWLDRNSGALIGAGAGLAGILVALVSR
jgi:polysaccharide export outer membrane protein